MKDYLMRLSPMKMKIKRSLLAGAVALACGNALGAEYWLCAGTFDKSMPDGSTVRMWGYADVTGVTAPTLHACPASPTAAYTAPGPQLNVADTDSNLTIHLKNTLAEPTSLVIPGQTENGMAPVKVGNRVRSFTHEAAAAVGVTPGEDSYTWNNLKPGSYAYQTGTHPAKQVQMGLYGAMVKDAAVGTAYPGINYDTQVVEFLSEIDPVMHSRVANESLSTGDKFGTPCASPAEQKANPCTSTIGYNPKWFLVNGDVFVDPTPAALPTTVPAGSTGGTTLIRFINMGLRSHSMILQGASMKVVAEDGHVLPAPHDQYSLMVAAGKTHDALFVPSLEGVYPLYERMHNLSTKDGASIKAGGMMSFLEVGANTTTLTAVNDVFSGNEDTVITGNVLSNDTFPPSSTVVLVSSPASGTLNLNAANGSFTFTPDANFNGQISFTYQVNDGALPVNNLSNVATVDLNVVAVNDAPVITSSAVPTATEDAPYTDTVTASDVDVGQTLSYSLVTAPAGMTINATSGVISWMPTNTQVGDNNVTVKATDSSGAGNNSANHSFIVAVSNVNDAPTLNTIPAQNAVVGTAFNLSSVGNDVDVGDTFTYSLSGPAGMTVDTNTGAINWPAPVLGVHNVIVTVTDALGLFASQPFTLNVTAVAATPVVYFSTFGSTNPTGLGGTADDADIYSWNGVAFSRVVDVTTKGVSSAANVDELKIVDATHFYLSFVTDTNLPGIGTVQDEDIVYNNNGTWSVFFDGTPKGLTNTNHDVDAFDIAGNTVYFSTSGSTNAPGVSNPPGVTGTADNADIYSWNGTAFSRVVDLSTIGVPAANTSASASNVDGLKFVDSSHFYASFAGNVALTQPAGGTLAVQDEDIVYYNNGVWSVYFDGTAVPKSLTNGNQDIDGFDIKPLP
jgi:Bacterial Ig domain/Putative Ig domain/Multicopper oxidase